MCGAGEARTWLLSRARTCRSITLLTSGRSWTQSPKIARKRLRTTSGSRDQTAQDANSATERSSSKTSVFLVSIFYSFLLTSLSNNGKETNTKWRYFLLTTAPRISIVHASSDKYCCLLYHQSITPHISPTIINSDMAIIKIIVIEKIYKNLVKSDKTTNPKVLLSVHLLTVCHQQGFPQFQSCSFWCTSFVADVGSSHFGLNLSLQRALHLWYNSL